MSIAYLRHIAIKRYIITPRPPLTPSSRLSQPPALGSDIPSDLLLVSRQQATPPHHHLAVDNNRLRPGGRGQRQAGQDVLDPGVGQVIDAEARDIGTPAGCERAAIVPAQALSPAGRRQAPHRPSIECKRRSPADPG